MSRNTIQSAIQTLINDWIVDQLSANKYVSIVEPIDFYADHKRYRVSIDDHEERTAAITSKFEEGQDDAVAKTEAIRLQGVGGSNREALLHLLLSVEKDGFKSDLFNEVTFSIDPENVNVVIAQVRVTADHTRQSLIDE